jgi:hypothetical protein
MHQAVGVFDARLDPVLFVETQEQPGLIVKLFIIAGDGRRSGEITLD